MKTEAELRAHLAALRAAIVRPCDCAGTAHAEPCRIGGMMLCATADALAWALGENPGYEEVVRHFARQDGRP